MAERFEKFATVKVHRTSGDDECMIGTVLLHNDIELLVSVPPHTIFIFDSDALTSKSGAFIVSA